MSPVSVVILAIVAIGLTILYRGTVYHLRLQCGTRLAERLCLVGNVGALALAATGVVMTAVILYPVALALAAAANFFPSLLIRLTGGPRPLCGFLRAVDELFELLRQRPLSDENIAAAQSQRAALDRFRSAATGPTIDAIDTIFEARFPDDIDHAATLRAYDALDAALAALKTAHPW